MFRVHANPPIRSTHLPSRDNVPVAAPTASRQDTNQAPASLTPPTRGVNSERVIREIRGADNALAEYSWARSLMRSGVKEELCLMAVSDHNSVRGGHLR